MRCDVNPAPAGVWIRPVFRRGWGRENGPALAGAGALVNGSEEKLYILHPPQSNFKTNDWLERGLVIITNAAPLKLAEDKIL